MPSENFTYHVFESERKRLIDAIHKSLTLKQKQMIISFAEGQPQWMYENWSTFPGISWKLLNINKLKQKNPKKFKIQIEKLYNLFN